MNDNFITEMTNQFSYNVYCKVRPLVKGKVKCRCHNDHLYCDIYTECGTSFNYTVSSISDKICDGLTSEDISYRIIKAYKQYINGIFFQN